MFINARNSRHTATTAAALLLLTITTAAQIAATATPAAASPQRLCGITDVPESSTGTIIKLLTPSESVTVTPGGRVWAGVWFTEDNGPEGWNAAAPTTTHCPARDSTASSAAWADRPGPTSGPTRGRSTTTLPTRSTCTPGSTTTPPATAPARSTSPLATSCEPLDRRDKRTGHRRPGRAHRRGDRGPFEAEQGCAPGPRRDAASRHDKSDRRS